MSSNLRVLQVFIASPSDLRDERRAIKEMADSLNNVFTKTVGLQVQLLGWEDRLPGYGRPQAQINEDVDKADIFIGFLWRRWGSDPGNPDYTSGFEEEYFRAIQRREKQGSPEIAIFFKDVDAQALNDPGDQLKRVLDFRKEVENSKKILFRTFSDVVDWKSQTRDLLESHLLRHVANIHSGKQQSEINASPIATITPEPTGKLKSTDNPAASAQMLASFHNIEAAIRKGEFAQTGRTGNVDRLSLARLVIATCSLTTNEIEELTPGAHQLNLLYKNKEKTELSRLEIKHILRVNLTDIDENKPGWYWIRKRKLDYRAVLLYLACNDKEVAVRVTAFNYISKLGIHLEKKREGTPCALDRLIRDSDEQMRIAVLDHLYEKGSEKNLHQIEKLITDDNLEVRNKAEQTHLKILLKKNPVSAIKDHILPATWISDEIISIVAPHVHGLPRAIIENCLTHADDKIRILATKELVKSGKVAVNDLDKIAESSYKSELIHEILLAQIKAGTPITPDDIREAMGRGRRRYYFHRTQSANTLISILFRKLSYDELIKIEKSNSIDSAVAYQILAEDHFKLFETTLRDDLKTNFKRQKDGSKHIEALGMLRPPGIEQPATPNTVEYLLSSLKGLSHHGEPSDRALVIPLLGNDDDKIKLAAIRCMQKIGKDFDAENLIKISENSEDQISEEAAYAAIKLSPGPTGAVKKLAMSKNEWLVKIAAKEAAACSDIKIWDIFEPRLLDPNQNIRRYTCALALQILDRTKLTKLLKRYLTRERYYYNIVFIIDRALYARPPLKQIFIHEVTNSLSEPSGYDSDTA